MCLSYVNIIIMVFKNARNIIKRENMKTEHKIRVVLSAYLNKEKNKRIIDQALCCVYSLLSQSYQNFEIFIPHDGPLDDPSLADAFRKLSPKITFIDNLKKTGCWGFYHRYPTAMIEPHADWVLFTNEDNYYVPEFFNLMMNETRNQDTGMVYCNMIHSAHHWSAFESIPLVDRIDMGAFISRMDLVKSTEWTDFCHNADGIYAAKIAQKTKPVKAKGYLFVHN